MHEFDYKGENAVIYEDNGVIVRSWPAIHSIDGPLSLAENFMVSNITRD